MIAVSHVVSVLSMLAIANIISIEKAKSETDIGKTQVLHDVLLLHVLLHRVFLHHILLPHVPVLPILLLLIYFCSPWLTAIARSSGSQLRCICKELPLESLGPYCAIGKSFPPWSPFLFGRSCLGNDASEQVRVSLPHVLVLHLLLLFSYLCCPWLTVIAHLLGSQLRCSCNVRFLEILGRCCGIGKLSPPWPFLS